MRALVYDAYGPPDGLRIEELELPTVGPGEIRVRVVASSLNDWDRDLLRGEPLNRAIAPFRPKHRVLGSDVSGVVDAVAPDVAGIAPGDAVMADLSPHGFGGFAEYAVAPASAWSPLPAGLSHEQAAAIPQAAGLAVTGLRASQRLTPGRRVAVNGAGGGVGTFAVQLAKQAGAHVTAVDAAWKLDALRALGADDVVDYAVEDFTARQGAYDTIVDISTHRSVRDYLRALAPGGVCSVLGGQKRRMLSVVLAGSAVSAVGSKRVHMPQWRANDPRDLDYLRPLLESGAVVPVVDSVVALEDVPAAFVRIMTQQHVGKVVVRIWPASALLGSGAGDLGATALRPLDLDAAHHGEPGDADARRPGRRDVARARRPTHEADRVHPHCDTLGHDDLDPAHEGEDVDRRLARGQDGRRQVQLDAAHDRHADLRLGHDPAAPALDPAPDRDRHALRLVDSRRIDGEAGRVGRHRHGVGLGERDGIRQSRQGEDAGWHRQVVQDGHEIGVRRGLVDVGETLLVLDGRQPTLGVRIAQETGDLLAVRVGRAQPQGGLDRVRRRVGHARRLVRPESREVLVGGRR